MQAAAGASVGVAILSLPFIIDAIPRVTVPPPQKAGLVSLVDDELASRKTARRARRRARRARRKARASAAGVSAIAAGLPTAVSPLGAA